MWDYDKLFAEGNIVGFKNEVEGRFGVYQITKDKELPREARYYNFGKRWDDFKNTNLARSVIFIQYIIRLDEHGNVIEKLFDRERDIPPSMPELKHGMIIKINYKDRKTLGYVDKHRDLVVYQDGTYDTIDSYKDWMETDIVAIYDDVECFNQCDRYDPIWEKSNYFNS